MAKQNQYLLPGDVQRSLKRVSSKLSSFKASDFVEEDLRRPSAHLLGLKSKLLRPTMVLLGASGIGENPDKFIDLAVSAELLHVSSLIHDDIVDNDKIRRGGPAVHVKYGSQMAILAGDALISKAVELASPYGAATLKSMSRATMNMCAGEALDYKYQKNKSTPSIQQYSRIACLKSGALIGACWNAAAVYKSSKLSGRMYQAGCDLGVAFQIRDDIIDFISASRKGGGKDLAPNAVTSIMKSSKAGRYLAIIEAMKLNNSYIDSSKKILSGTSAGEVLSEYAALIRVVA